MSIYQHLLFLACVALATYAQTMTGFAFGLVLLGLSGVFQLASVSEVANVVSVLSLVNAAVTLARAKPQVNWRLLAPALGSSLAGVVAGVFALAWIGGSMAVALQLLLGVTIMACAVLLVARAEPCRACPRAVPSSSSAACPACWAVCFPAPGLPWSITCTASRCRWRPSATTC